MNLKSYISSLIKPIMNENISLQQLIDNFRKVFPYSEKDNGVINYHTDKYSTDDNKPEELNTKQQETEEPNNQNSENSSEENIETVDEDPKDLEVEEVEIKKENENILHGIAYVQSGKNEHGKHRVEVRIKRKDTSKPFSIKDEGQVYCDCNAFRYRVAYPLYKNNALEKGQMKSNNTIPNKVQNPNKIPTICKHCYSFLIHLYNKGELRNN